MKWQTRKVCKPKEGLALCLVAFRLRLCVRVVIVSLVKGHRFFPSYPYHRIQFLLTVKSKQFKIHIKLGQYFGKGQILFGIPRSIYFYRKRPNKEGKIEEAAGTHCISNSGSQTAEANCLQGNEIILYL